MAAHIMARSLVIVESPAKAKTINKYLGRNFSVKASLGHVMDLPKKSLSIDIEKDFKPTYEPIPGKSKVVNELKRAAKEAEAVYLAADPDREGEAICAHLAELLGTNKKERAKIFRVMFNEITQKAIKAAFEKPGQVDTNLVDAQQARRVLDRLVGYKISPLLWDKVRRGLSAGRVQTVALRLIVEREQEIRAFKPVEYWSIHASLEAGVPPPFEAKLYRVEGKSIAEFFAAQFTEAGAAEGSRPDGVPNETESQRIAAECEKSAWRVSAVTQKEKRRNPAPPFTTSKLQQAAYNKLRFTAKRTMMLAQRLYEGIELGEEGSVGLITYMRTDSVRVSNDALAEVRELVQSEYGAAYLPEKPNFYKSKKDAQEAHEAIRPSSAARTPESVRRYMEEDMFKLYQLIWQRFVASQMTPAVFDQTTIDIAAGAKGQYTFRASGSVLKFNGFLAAYQIGVEDQEKEDEGDEVGRALPPVREGETLKLIPPVRPEQHFTEPPPRYTEATLVKELEEKGIGRPSTYAAIISTIVEREYVTKDQGRFTPTQLGEKVTTLLVKSFEDIFDVGFTARMEEELDEIEEGKLPWRKAVKDFYGPFEKDLELAKGEMESYKAGIPTDQKCEKCGQGILLERISRHGFFLGCSRYPDCDFIRDLAPDLADGSETVESEAVAETCENCGKEMAIKRGRFGPFLACTGYPDCKTTRRLVAGTKVARKPDELLDEKCPLCGKQLVKKHGRFGEFVGCTGYPKCKFIRSQTLGIACPKCGKGEIAERRAKKGRMRVFYGCNQYPECDFTTPHRPIAEPCPKCKASFVVEKRLKTGAVRACLKDGCGWEAPAPDSPDSTGAPTPAPASSFAPVKS
jgi:DNA topoisomerase-1